jgi:hypothetical protein
MPSIEQTIADEIVAHINGSTLVLPANAKRSSRSSIDLEAFTGVRTIVVPARGQIEAADRGSVLVRLTFVVMVERKLSATPATAEAEADQLGVLRDQIEDLLYGFAPASVGAPPDEAVTKLWDEKATQDGLSIARQLIQLSYPPIAKEGGA